MFRKFASAAIAAAALAGATFATTSTAQAGYGYGHGYGHRHYGYVKVYRPWVYVPVCHKVVRYDYWGNAYWTRRCH